MRDADYSFVTLSEVQLTELRHKVWERLAEAAGAGMQVADKAEQMAKTAVRVVAILADRPFGGPSDE